MAKERQLAFDEISEEWKGMPEYYHKKVRPFRSITVNFRNQEDFDRFCELIGEELMEKRRSTWFPKLERGADSNMRWVDANEGDTETTNDEVRDLLE